SAVGAANRPFVSPDEFVELKVRTAVCDQESLGVRANAADNLITLLFTPPPNGTPTGVVLTDDCAVLGAGLCSGGTSPGISCLSSADGAGAGPCVGANAAAGICQAGPTPGAPCTSAAQCGGSACSGPSWLSRCESQLPSGGKARCRLLAAGPNLQATI